MSSRFRARRRRADRRRLVPQARRRRRRQSAAAASPARRWSARADGRGRQRPRHRRREDLRSRLRRRPLRRARRPCVGVDRGERPRAAAHRCCERCRGEAPRAEGATRLGILGCGFQAETQAACIRAAVPTIDTSSPTAVPKRTSRTSARARRRACETHREACVDCDVVVAATTSKDPVLRGEWLQAGALVCAMGANHPEPPRAGRCRARRATFVCCDSRAGRARI